MRQRIKVLTHDKTRHTYFIYLLELRGSCWVAWVGFNCFDTKVEMQNHCSDNAALGWVKKWPMYRIKSSCWSQHNMEILFGKQNLPHLTWDIHLWGRGNTIEILIVQIIWLGVWPTYGGWGDKVVHADCVKSDLILPILIWNGKGYVLVLPYKIQSQIWNTYAKIDI